MTKGGHIDSARELPRGERLSVEIKMVTNEKSYSTQEAKRRSGTEVGLPSGTGARERERGPKEKVYWSSVCEVSPKGKKVQCNTHIKKEHLFR